MNDQRCTVSNSIVVLLSVLLISGCTLKASTESLTDATTNFSSSTTPGAWFTLDGLLNPSQRVNAFFAINVENLRQDVAQGNGEYLTALGSLLDIPLDQMTSFKLQAQECFSQIYETGPITPQLFTHLVSELN